MSQKEAASHSLLALYDMNVFFKAVEDKDVVEIIFLADQEATAAWRLAYRLRESVRSGAELANGYGDTLVELIYFLRSALDYRPSKISPEVYERLYQLQESRAEGQVRPARLS